MVSFPSTIELSSLDGSNGFTLRAATGIRLNTSRFAVSDAGDINNDGIDDVVIGIGADTIDEVTVKNGESYVVFGKSIGFDNNIDLRSLNGRDGFRLLGISQANFAGSSVSGLGDVNGDGIDDLIIGAPGVNIEELRNGGIDAGQSYVVYGSNQTFSPVVELSSLNGQNGFTINSIKPSSIFLQNQIGSAVSSAGDVNGDGINDILLGVPTANPSNQNQRETGGSYVIFGRNSNFSSVFELSSLNGNNGFEILGINNDDNAGRSVGSAGDVNNDGIDDLIIGAPNADLNSQLQTGEGYVVFGKRSGFGRSINLSDLNGNNGFAIRGATQFTRLGSAVSGVGDINADGIDDFAIGAPGGNDGKAYVVFGRNVSFGPSLDLSTLNGNNGFVIDTPDLFAAPNLGGTLSGTGDVNGDGIDDLVVGLTSATSARNSYVIFGSNRGFAPQLKLTDLNGSNGFNISSRNSPGLEGIGAGSVSGAGDINNDGVNDIILGSGYSDVRRQDRQSYVILGRQGAETAPTVKGRAATAYVNGANVVVGDAFQARQAYQGVLSSNTDGTGNANDAILGTSGGDNIWGGTQGNDVIDGGAGSDAIGMSDGNVCVNAGAGDDLVYAVSRGAGNNEVDLGSGDDNFYAQAGNNTVTGSGKNLVGAGTGNDTITLQGGNDFVYSVDGGGGTDTVNLGNGRNNFYAENGNYTVTAGSGDDLIGLGSGTDRVNAGNGNNVIYRIGGSTAARGNKDIVTGSGEDYVETGRGSDRIDGGSGLNSLFGGAGRDIFTIRSGAYNFLGDFQLGTDRIQLAGLSFGQLDFFQGSAATGKSGSTFIFANNVGIAEVTDSTVAGLDNAANFV